MRTLLKSLLATASFLALAPLPASALPNPCDQVCRCTSSCNTLCTIGGSVVTCGFDGICIGQCAAPSEQQASVAEEPRASDEAAPVCEEPQAAESAPSAES
ncbi:hypothetical protein JY651_13210 [Pyxidicoccus parkwayensis]|uniref:Lipoprotein n=1 Tax=Pyxidicoccus parkwayensis TaxID=2813578 RepID=A0ABX7P5S2_9BACT|nr:hypothetical protein [Pyxidicoccus parkwaysis]QSQ25823.1 hypothetical protein JY651_13210 [Pyxidicoccus parkwaysis]